MADIDLRFHKDMLVLSSPVLPALERLGLNTKRDAELSMLLEPDTFEDVYQLEVMAGAQCLVANTAALTQARLAQVGMEGRADELAQTALAIVQKFKPQHILVEIEPCGLPLDGSSKASLRENREQYAQAGRLFADQEFDAFFLNGFTTSDDLKCALMGLRKVDSRPVFASVDVRTDGMLTSGRTTLGEALDVMNEFEASVAGFATAASLPEAVQTLARIVEATTLPILVQLDVRACDPHQNDVTEENPYFTADTMEQAADVLWAHGAQFLRATGNATPAYTGVLAAMTSGRDVCLKP